MSRRPVAAATESEAVLRHTYPGEKPSKAELIKWLQASRDTFGTIGYGPFLRGEDPYEFAKLAPLPEESAAAGASAEVVAAIDSENRAFVVMSQQGLAPFLGLDAMAAAQGICGVWIGAFPLADCSRTGGWASLVGRRARALHG